MALTNSHRMTGQAARQRYLSEKVLTASPAGLVTMLYDALVSDLTRAEQAIADGDRHASHERLVHAQAIVFELRAGLKPDLWSGGPGLASLYTYFVQELIDANITRNAAKVAQVRELVEPLRDAWHVAATQMRAAS